MYAIIETGGKQYKVQPGDVIDVETLTADDDNKIELDKVVAVSGDDGKMTVGAPTVDGATVSAELIEQGRAAKKIVFKMKRRKGNRRKHGHRQGYSRVRILDINAG